MIAVASPGSLDPAHSTSLSFAPSSLGCSVCCLEIPLINPEVKDSLQRFSNKRAEAKRKSPSLRENTRKVTATTIVPHHSPLSVKYLQEPLDERYNGRTCHTGVLEISISIKVH